MQPWVLAVLAAMACGGEAAPFVVAPAHLQSAPYAEYVVPELALHAHSAQKDATKGNVARFGVYNV